MRFTQTSVRFTQASVRFTHAKLGQVRQLKSYYMIHDRVVSSPRNRESLPDNLRVAPTPQLSPGEDLVAAAGATSPPLPYYQVKMAVTKNALVTRLARPDRVHTSPHARGQE